MVLERQAWAGKQEGNPVLCWAPTFPGRGGRTGEGTAFKQSIFDAQHHVKPFPLVFPTLYSAVESGSRREGDTRVNPRDYTF